MPPVVSKPVRKKKWFFLRNHEHDFWIIINTSTNCVENYIQKWCACSPWWRTWFHELSSFSEATFLLKNVAQLHEENGNGCFSGIFVIRNVHTSAKWNSSLSRHNFSNSKEATECLHNSARAIPCINKTIMMLSPQR
jgi:hypothetical protein